MKSITKAAIGIIVISFFLLGIISIQAIEGKSLTISTVRLPVYLGTYRVLKQTGNEQIYNVTFKFIPVEIGWHLENRTVGKKIVEVNVTDYRNDTLICMESNVEEHEFESKEIYKIPARIEFYKTRTLIRQMDINMELIKGNPLSLTPYDFERGDTYRFCYQANPNDDFYMKFGEDSIIVIQEDYIQTDAYLVDVLAETGAENFTHLNISDTSPYDSLVGYWSFDGDKENTKLTTHYDFTENDNDGTGAGDAVVNSTDCIYDDCLQPLDGTGDYVELTTSGLSGTGNYTISAWIYIEGAGVFGSPIFAIDLYDPSWCLREDGANHGICIWDGAWKTCGSELSEDRWYHVAWVREGTGADQTKYYINGSLDGTTTHSDSISDDTSYIGTDGLAQNEFVGQIDEVMVFNVSLNSAQISDIYNNQSNRFKSTGTQRVRAVNITNSTNWDDNGYNRINLTATFENNMDSNISARIGQINSSVNVSDLVLYMPFEWSSAVDISGQGNDGTLVGDTTFNETGGLNDTGGFEFDGTDDVVTTGTPLTTRNITIMGWYKDPDANGQHGSLWSASEGTSYKYYLTEVFETGGDDNWYLFVGDGRSYDVIFNIGLGSAGAVAGWHHYAITINSTDARAYWDGTDVGGGTIVRAETAFTLQISSDDYRDFDGSADEVMVFNRSLSATEISQIFANQSAEKNQIYYTAYQNLTTSGSEQEFTINTEADFALPDFKFWSGNATTDFYTPILNGSNMSLETWTWTATVDETPPTITIQRPANTTYRNDTVWFNVTMNETGGECLVDFGYGNNTMTNSSGNWNFQNTSMIDDTYQAIYWCDDASDNYDTASIWFTVDICNYVNNTGNWDINQTCEHTNGYFNISGNLTLFENGLLNLTNTTLNFTSTEQWMIFENTADADKFILNEYSGVN